MCQCSVAHLVVDLKKVDQVDEARKEQEVLEAVGVAAGDAVCIIHVAAPRRIGASHTTS